MNSLKKWFETLSGATQFMIILSILLTLVNIALMIISAQKSAEASNIVHSFYSETKGELFYIFELDNLFIQLKQTTKFIFLFLINILFWSLSYIIGKTFGLFKSIAELFIDIYNDGWGYFSLLLYNLVNVVFDLLALYSFITTK